ncbi:MAG: hypothetical protein MUF23_14765 [Pirellula sp.]|nr:hypothetical protein [Pirellula sp.]
MSTESHGTILQRLFGPSVPFAAVALVAVLVVAILVMFPNLGRQRTSLADDEPLEVKTLIRKVKEELQAAEFERVNQKELPLLQLQDFEMEINFVVRNAGGVRAEVVGIGSNIDLATEKVQKLKLHWTAVPATQKSVAPGDFSKQPDVDIPAEPVTPGGKAP